MNEALTYEQKQAAHIAALGALVIELIKIVEVDRPIEMARLSAGATVIYNAALSGAVRTADPVELESKRLMVSFIDEALRTDVQN